MFGVTVWGYSLSQQRRLLEQLTAVAVGARNCFFTSGEIRKQKENARERRLPIPKPSLPPPPARYQFLESTLSLESTDRKLNDIRIILILKYLRVVAKAIDPVLRNLRQEDQELSISLGLK